MAQDKAFWVEFMGDRSFQIEKGQTILEASLQAGISHYHACGGKGKCSTCRILVQQGEEHLSPVSEKEVALKKKFPFADNIRLACQTYVLGAPVQLHRMIRDEDDISLYISGNSCADLHNIGEEIELALFFLDIRHFTPFIERHPPFDVIHVLRRLFSLFRKGIEQHGGQIIETAGDGFYAVFGFETSLKVAVNGAYQAARTILSTLEDFNDQYLEKHFFHRLQAGIGLHAGRVIVGNVGIGVNNNLTVMGLAVNIAARLQAATKELNNNLMVSEKVCRYLLAPKPQGQRRRVNLKGVSKPLAVRLLGSAFTPHVCHLHQEAKMLIAEY